MITSTDKIHPSDDSLRRFACGEMSGPPAETIEVHIETCAVCNDRLRQHGNDSLQARLKSVMAVPRPVRAPEQSSNLADAETILPTPGSVVAERPQPSSTKEFADSGGSSSDGDSGRCGEKLPTIPGFEVLGVLGRGGMGVVYKARQVGLKRFVALKMILSGAYAAQGERVRFVKEAEAVARLQHPNIVQIHQIGEHDDNPYFSLEYCDGGSLAGLLNGTPLPAINAAHVVRLLAQAMQAAHEQNIIHRDLKPANVLLQTAASGQWSVAGKDKSKPTSSRATDHWPLTTVPKITDFGLAKQLDEAGQTASGAVMGTPSYMAPEQASGETKTHGPAADIYALGAILYECLTGRPPFKAASSLETVMMVIGADPVPPSQLNPKTPRDLETICLKCLQKEPKKRYGAAADLADDLARFVQGEPISARPVGRVERSWRWCRRNPAVAGLLALIVLTVLGGVGGILHQLTRAVTAEADQRDKAVKLEIAVQERDAKAEQLKNEAEVQKKLNADLAAANLTAEAKTLKVRQALAHSKMFSAQNHWENGQIHLALDLLEEVEPEFRLGGWSFLKRNFEGGLFTMYGHLGRVNSVSFSPDGQRLASACADGTVKIWDAQTGRDLLTLTGHTSPVATATFSRDGQRLITVTETTRNGREAVTKVWDARTGLELRTIKERLVSFSPDGERMAWPDGNVVKVCAARSGQEIVTLKAQIKFTPTLGFSPDGQQLATTSADGTVKLWDARTGQDLMTFKSFKEHEHNVTCVSISPDGQRLASTTVAGSYETMTVWNTRTGQPLYGFTGRLGVERVAFSPDGQRLASPNKIWDARTGQELLTLHGFGSFSPDGLRFASTYWDKIQLWDAAAGRELLTLKGHTGKVAGAAFSPDGRLLATASADGTVKLWDTRAEHDLLAVKHGGVVTGLSYSPDGLHLAANGGGATVKVFDPRTGQEQLSLAGGAKFSSSLADTSVCFSPDGRRLAAVFERNSVKVWNASTRQELLTRKHADYVYSVKFSPDGQRLASSSGKDKTVKIWDAQSGADLVSIEGHLDAVTGVCFSPDGRRLATASRDKTVKVWDAHTGKNFLTLGDFMHGVATVSFSPDGGRLVTAGATLKVWDAHNGQELLTIKEGGGHASFSPDGERLVSAGGDTVKVWDARTGQKLLTIKTQVKVVSFSPDGQRLASGAGDHWLKLWDVRTGNDFPILKGHESRVARVTFSPDGQRLASVSDDHVVKVWHVPTGRELFALTGHTVKIEDLAFSPDGKRLVFASCDATVKIWDALTGQELMTFQGHSKGVCNVAFSPDGQRVVSLDLDRTIKVWDAQTGRDLLTIKANAFHIFAENVSFSADGKRIVVRSRQKGLVHLIEAPRVNLPRDSGKAKTIWLDDLIFDAQSGELLTAAQDVGPIRAPLAVTPDGKTLAWPYADKIYLVPLVPPAAAELDIRQQATRLRGDWHEEESLRHEKAKSWHAAAFHRGWAARADPHRLEHWEKLNELCRHLHGQWRDELAKDKIELAQPDLLAWQAAADALERVLKEQPTIRLTLPDEKDAPGLHLSLALTLQRLGNAALAKERFGLMHLSANASPGLKQLHKGVAEQLANMTESVAAKDIPDPKIARPNPVKVEGLSFKDGAAQIAGALTPEDGNDAVHKASFCRVYTIKLTAKQTYHIGILSKDMDCLLRVEDASGKLLESGSRPTMVFPCGQSGTYRIVATTAAPAVQGGFTLCVLDKVPVKTSELVLQDAAAKIKGELTEEDGKDPAHPKRYCRVYTIKLTASKTYEFVMASNEIEPCLRLENASGTKLAQRHDDSDVRIVFTCRQTGTYRLMATAFEPDDTGGFTLSVREK